MKSTLKFFFLIAGMTAFMTACNNAPEGEKVDAEDAQEVNDAANSNATSFQIDGQSSVINWTGAKATKQHIGTLNISKGELLVENGQLVGGKAVIDMNSLTVLDDIGDDMKAKLTGHLKSDDFFDVGVHSEGSFEITKVEAAASEASEATHQVTGNLTLMGVSKSITIPANIIVADNQVSAVSTAFKINRTDWGANYGSGVIGTVGEAIIYDEVGIVLNLSASKS